MTPFTLFFLGGAVLLIWVYVSADPAYPIGKQPGAVDLVAIVGFALVVVGAVGTIVEVVT